MKPNYVAKKSALEACSFLWILSCILIIPIFALIFRIIAVRQYRIEFYDDKVIVYSGLLNKRRTQCVFMGVVATGIEQTLMGQMFNYGDVIVDCVGRWDIDTTCIKAPRELEAYLQTKIVQKPQTNQFVEI